MVWFGVAPRMEETGLHVQNGAIHDWDLYFWDKGIKDYVALDLSVYYDLLLFDQ